MNNFTSSARTLSAARFFKDNPSKNKLQRHVVLGAVKAMTPNEQEKMAQIVALAKQGNTNAQKALIALQAQGYAATMGYAPPTARVSGKAMTPSEQQKLAALIKAAQQKHPGALRALALLRTQGYTVSMGTDTRRLGHRRCLQPGAQACDCSPQVPVEGDQGRSSSARHHPR